MAVATRRRPHILRRMARSLGEAYGIVESRERAAWIEEGSWQHHNDLLGSVGTASTRRAMRTNIDLTALYSAVFACMRLRTRMVTRPRIYLVRSVDGADPVEIDKHPALDAFRRMNEGMTERQGRALIEQYQLGHGEAFLIKRRDRLGTVVEFEFWPPDQVEIVPDKKKPWVATAYKRHYPDGLRVDTVLAADVVPFRHFLDPRNPLRGLSPIGAIRSQIDTSMEAMRYNQRFFDNDTNPSRMFTVEEGGPAEVERIEQELERKFKGTDNAHRAMVVEGGLSVVEGSTPIAHKDMQFLEQQVWTRGETAMVFEMSPISLGAVEGSTFSNVEWVDKKDWNVIVDQVENTLAQFTEFMLWPDFDPTLSFAADFSMIPALQGDLKLRADVDDVRLKGAVITVNEIRERDKLPPVPWGDTPVVQNTLEPLDIRTAAEKDAAAATVLAATSKASANAQQGSDVPSDKPAAPRAIDGADMPDTLDQSQERMAQQWERRLRRELRGIIDHIDAADRRKFSESDIDSYDWDWRDEYGPDVIVEVRIAYEAALNAADFMATPLMPTHELAVRYAQARAAELLSDRGRFSIPAGTRERVRVLVTEALKAGDSIRALKNALRKDEIFSARRAETIARTETVTAMGRASIQAYTSNGYEGKEWRTAGALDGVCNENAAAGAIRVHDIFPSGDDAPPAHPNCRCTLVPVFEMQRSTVVHKKGTLDGREIDIVETTEVR